ncbi:MAG: hypothetical protein CVU27_01695 [Betaproteobacteria bacterium HGW-Betaproteobacteria-20]|jgi:hypothetical protein|nr:MAG: hypothetical protein CVU27_01695 [Betaproteobacteria bacterium HGW-Betaproteobacteria-20]
MKNTVKIISCIGALVLSGLASAVEAQTDALLYISQNNYQHIRHPYYSDYWFEQGPMLEPIAFAALNAKEGGVTLCTANETNNTVIRIQPSVFYNPQMQIYHGKLVATVYSGGGNVLGTYTGKAQQIGFLGGDKVNRYYLNKVYTSAMQDLMTKLKIDPVLESAKAENKLPCGFIGAQADRRINFY